MIRGYGCVACKSAVASWVRGTAANAERTTQATHSFRRIYSRARPAMSIDPTIANLKANRMPAITGPKGDDGVVDAEIVEKIVERANAIPSAHSR